MKKLFLFFASALILVACGNQQQTMTINGVIDPILEIDGAEVTLTIKAIDTTITQSTFLADNTFTLQTEIDSPQISQLQVAGLGNYVICLEPGTISFVVTANDDPESKVAAFIECTGTPNNDLLNEYNNAIYALQKDMFAATSDEEVNAIDSTYIAMTYSFIVEHINTLASTYIFANTSPDLNLEQIGNILPQLTEENLQYGRIPRVKESYEALLNTQVGQSYVDFALPTPEGGELALSSLVGQTDYVLVDFWASWCPPCRRAMPMLKELYNANQGKLEILGVSLDDDAEAWKGAIETLGLNWKHISDLQGWKCAAGQLYGVSFIPTTILIDKEGTIVGRNLSEEELKAFVSTK